MKPNSQGALPPSRLPVLTEVVQLVGPVDPLDGLPDGVTDAPAPTSHATGGWFPASPPASTSPAAPIAMPAAAPVPSSVPAPVPAPGYPSAMATFAQAPAADVSSTPAFAFEPPSPPEWLKRRPAESKVELPLPEMAPQTPLPSDFSGSWWSRDEGPAVLPSSAPVPVPIPAPRAAPALSEEAIVRRVLAGLDAQMDLMFDHRMRDALVPVLARAADLLMLDLREQLGATLNEMVAHAVAIEVARHGRDSGTI